MNEISLPSLKRYFSKVRFCADAFEEVRRELAKKRAFLFTDKTVLSLYPTFAERLGAACYAMPAGEKFKTKETLFKLLEEMAKARIRRGDVLVVLGGGVPGDIGGLAAALYMRGISLIQIPTTLLAQVDSSVGGKTAIDFGGVKNLIGAFYPADLTLIDVNFLSTLPVREVKCGLGEIVKHAAIEERLFALLKKQQNLLDLQFLAKTVPMNIRIKADIVKRDPFETGLRKMLNFGHTTAHAIELACGYSHGESVMAGMYVETALSARRGGDREYLEGLRRLILRAYGGVPVLPPFEALGGLVLDKKNQNGIALVLPVTYGKFDIIEYPLDKFCNEYEAVRGGL